MKQLSQKEIKRLLNALLDGDESARVKLIEGNLPAVVDTVREIVDSKVLDDLITVGAIGLIKAVNSFNGDNPEQFRFWISEHVYGEIQKYLERSKKNETFND